MAHLRFIAAILLASSLVSPDTQPTQPKAVDLDGDSANPPFKCGDSKINTKLEYCTVSQACDKAGLIKLAKDMEYQRTNPTDSLSFAICDKTVMNSQVQVRINMNPDVWKNVAWMICVEKDGKKSVEVEFGNKKLKYNPGKDRSEMALRCVSEGTARFDIYHYNEQVGNEEEGEVYKVGRYYIIFIFVSLLGTGTIMAVHYAFYLLFENQRLRKSVGRRHLRHDELWLKIERSERKPYDPDEIWAAMPLIHQQVAAEAALFLQKYKMEKFTPQLRQWIVDRAYPAGATEIILELAGLSDSEFPFYAPLERLPEHKNETRIADYSERIETRIVDTLNYANRLRRRKIVFTDHRFLDLHHIVLELALTTLVSPSHPTIHDAAIPVLPRHAFGTRDDPREDEKEQRESEARSRRPHFLHHDWDEAQRLLGSEA